MKINKKWIKESFKVFLKSFCAEILLCIMLFIVVEFKIRHVYKFDDYIFAYFPMFIVLTYVLNMLLKNKWRILYYVSIFAFVPLLFMDLKHTVFTASYYFGLLLSGFALLACKKCDNNEAFASNFIKTLLDLLFGFIVYNIFAGVVCLIILSVEYIFNLSSFSYYEDIYCFSVIVIFPLTFFFMQMHKPENNWNMPRFIEIILIYIICPAIIIYTVILYLYFIKIAVEWELPKGGIAYMVMCYFIVALMGRMLSNISKKQIYNWFFDRYMLISTPPVILFWIGLIYRIKLYSLTESRVYILVAGIMMCLIIVMLLSKKYGKYQLMLLLASAFIIMFTYIPAISAKNIGIISQKHRLDNYINELGLKDKNGGFLMANTVYLDKISQDSLKREIYYQLQSCYEYLQDNQGDKEVEKQYGACLNLKISKDKEDKFRYVLYEGNIDTSDYPFFCGILPGYADGDTGYYSTTLEGNLIIKLDGKDILIANIQQRLNRCLTNKFHDELFVYQNDSLRIIIGEIKIREKPDRKLIYYGEDNIALFKRSIDRQGNPSLRN